MPSSFLFRQIRWNLRSRQEKKDLYQYLRYVCDFCNNRIAPHVDGYLFYSPVVVPRQRKESGLMHLCGSCVDAYITDAEFSKPLMTKSSFVVQENQDPKALHEWLIKGHIAGIVAICKGHGFRATQAKAKARELARRADYGGVRFKAVKTFWLERKEPLDAL